LPATPNLGHREGGIGRRARPRGGFAAHIAA
jgi:hypothetical protein